MKACIFSLLILCGCVSGKMAMEELIKRYGDSQHGWRRANGQIKENPVLVTEKSLTNGQKLYQANCQPCHGIKGQGDGILAAKMNPKPANFNEMRGDRSDFHIYLQISLGNGVMPGRQDLTETDRWDIVNFVKSMVTKPSSDPVR